MTNVWYRHERIEKRFGLGISEHRYATQAAEFIDKIGIQGNLFNGLLYSDKKTLEKEVQDVLLGAKHYKRYIFNLSHGVFPDTEVDKLKFVVDKVHEFQWNS